MHQTKPRSGSRTVTHPTARQRPEVHHRGRRGRYSRQARGLVRSVSGKSCGARSVSGRKRACGPQLPQRPRRAAGHLKGRNGVEDPRSGLTRCTTGPFADRGPTDHHLRTSARLQENRWRPECSRAFHCLFAINRDRPPHGHVRTLNRFQERPLSSIGILLGRVGILVGSNSQKTCKTVYKKDLRLSLK